MDKRSNTGVMLDIPSKGDIHFLWNDTLNIQEITSKRYDNSLLPWACARTAANADSATVHTTRHLLASLLRKV
jgi:hypothetical protein